MGVMQNVALLCPKPFVIKYPNRLGHEPNSQRKMSSPLCMCGVYLTGIDDTQFREAGKEDDTALLKIMSNYGMHCSEQYSCKNMFFLLA